MSKFQRYAVYFLPDDAELAAFGASWLGWDVITAAPCARPDFNGLSAQVLIAATAKPRKYGFHGTLKPPFRLTEGADASVLARAVADLAARTPAFDLDGLQLSRINDFLALVAIGDTTELAQLALSCVTELDRFRRPADPGEVQRRRASGLSARQDALLVQWGYPYVAEEFRFHLTLSGRLELSTQDALSETLKACLPPLRKPFSIKSIALVGERSDGMFTLIKRYALTG